MFKKVLLGLLLLTLISCNKKENNSHLLSKYIQIEKVINTGCEFKSGFTWLLIALYKDDVYMRPQLTNKGLRINVYNQKTKKMKAELYNFNKPVSDSLKYSSEPDDFEVTEKNIYALFSRQLLIIDKYNSNNTRVINMNEGFRTLKVCGNDLILCRAYNFSDGKTPIRIAKYNLKSNKITNFIDITSDAYEFSYTSPLKWFDISQKGEIVFSQSISPAQNIYNSNLELMQTLFYKPKNWGNVDMTELNYIRKQKTQPSAQEIGERLWKTDDGVGCRMVSVNFANDSTLLVFYTTPNLPEKAEFVRYCNIWKKKNDKWVLFDKQLRVANPELSATLSKGNFPFNGANQQVRFLNNKAYYVFVSPNEKNLLQFGKKFSVVKNEMNRYFAEDRIYFQLFIFNCRF